ncbi:hypothetical protein BCM14_1483 [Jezberella montanilacus]|uniref:Uncharacterized protein n=1 Tax=Jezberella montanilacus TaxID=323426 RepID=A0A2T0XIE6_9BURK|nr:hypothetical protein [Jezberella montanilacus]PRY98650.1 hypothetical protein BCM14_1483 [Jezberella montanilacus]
MAKLVFVWLGSSLPAWGRAALQLSKRLSGAEIILISNRIAGPCIEADVQHYVEDFYQTPKSWQEANQTFDVKFRDGFWVKTTERFFVLEQFTQTFAIDSLFHAELDNLIFNLDGLSTKLDKLGRGIFCPRDAVNRGMASLIYINDTSALSELNVLAANNKLAEKNDMNLLGDLLNNSNKFFSLPTEHQVHSTNLAQWDAVSPDDSQGIFDAAALGQFLLGIDPRNGGVLLFNGFENENKGCDLWQLNYSININDRKFTIRNRLNGQTFNLFNIHVHSKLFSQLTNQNRFNRILGRINNGKTTLMNIDLMQNRICRSIKARLARGSL